MAKKVRGDVIQVMVTKEMKEKIREIADSKYLSMSTLVLQYISNGINADERVNEYLKPEKVLDMAAKISDL